MSGLLPVPPERRRRLLSQAGNVIENDLVQQSANQMVRTSRESCGCSCDGICYPETCECYINDIGCQVRKHFSIQTYECPIWLIVFIQNDRKLQFLS